MTYPIFIVIIAIDIDWIIEESYCKKYKDKDIAVIPLWWATHSFTLSLKDIFSVKKKATIACEKTVKPPIKTPITKLTPLDNNIPKIKETTSRVKNMILSSKSYSGGLTNNATIAKPRKSS